jgi:hypothetical protein
MRQKYGYVCAVACVGFAAGPQLRYTAFRWASTDLNVFLQLTHNSVQRPQQVATTACNKVFFVSTQAQKECYISSFCKSCKHSIFLKKITIICYRCYHIFKWFRWFVVYFLCHLLFILKIPWCKLYIWKCNLFEK